MVVRTPYFHDPMLSCPSDVMTPPPLFQRGGQRVRDRRHGVHSSGLPSTQVSYTLDYILFFKLKTIKNLVQHLVFFQTSVLFLFSGLSGGGRITLSCPPAELSTGSLHPIGQTIW